jgi:arylsulfatase A-like enzyme
MDDWRKIIALSWGYVTLIDEQIGRIMDVARELGLLDNTAVMFSVDHGAFVGSHRLEDKGPAMYDDIYHIPFILRLPDDKGGRVEDNFVSLTDFMPTFLDLAGVAKPAQVDGESVVPFARGETPAEWRQEVFAEFHGHHFPYPQRMIRTRRYKLVVNPGDLNELYDLETDPSELLNQYNHPELLGVRQELMTRLYDELKARGDNFYHWMTTMYDIGTKTYDTSLSQLDSK